jgi:hypothetical protein
MGRPSICIIEKQSELEQGRFLFFPKRKRHLISTSLLNCSNQDDFFEKTNTLHSSLTAFNVISTKDKRNGQVAYRIGVVA